MRTVLVRLDPEIKLKFELRLVFVFSPQPDPGIVGAIQLLSEDLSY